MDAKIKELLTRLSFFAEEGMGETKLVEFAKKADDLLMEVARKPNTQQPVAWCELTQSGKIGYFDGKPLIMVGDVGNDCHQTPLFTYPPVPRDVLVAALGDCRAECAKHYLGDADDSQINLAAIADRYASKVQPEPVNQQLLAAAACKRCDGSGWNKGGWICKKCKGTGSIAAAEAAQPAGQDGYAQGVEAVAKMLEKKADDFASENGYDDMGSLSFGGNLNGELMRDYHSGLLELAEEVRAMKTDCQQPASAQPVAVPDGVARATEAAAAAIYFADSSDYLGTLWDILRFLSPEIAVLAESDTRAAWERAEQDRAQLSAAQKPEGGE